MSKMCQTMPNYAILQVVIWYNYTSKVLVLKYYLGWPRLPGWRNINVLSFLLARSRIFSARAQACSDRRARPVIDLFRNSNSFHQSIKYSAGPRPSGRAGPRLEILYSSTPGLGSGPARPGLGSGPAGEMCN